MTTVIDEKISTRASKQQKSDQFHLEKIPVQTKTQYFSHCIQCKIISASMPQVIAQKTVQYHKKIYPDHNVALLEWTDNSSQNKGGETY